MAKFLNKKEQVYDLKLTSYAKHLLSVGKFRPTYYAFFDDNILYDRNYCGVSSSKEPQNEIHDRIKNETVYLESLVTFEDVEKGNAFKKGSPQNFFDLDITPTTVEPRIDIYKFDSALGDAFLEGDSNVAPAWKIAMLQGEIAQSAEKDVRNGTRIPQIDITLNYRKVVRDAEELIEPTTIRDFDNVTPNAFVDGKVIELKLEDAILYVEELNTELLTENFDVEVFKILTGSAETEPQVLQRKYFQHEIPQIVDGLLVSETPQRIDDVLLPSSSVEYYFDVLTDSLIDQAAACNGIKLFNKESYYIDIDFECDEESEDNLLYDIYERATGDPEICLD